MCSSYFCLGSIQQKLEKKDEASAFYQKIQEIWKKHILTDLEEGDVLERVENEDLYLDEAKEYLKHILLFFEVELGPQDNLTAECNIAFALVMLKDQNSMVALEYLEKAYYAFLGRLGEFDTKTKEVGELIKKIEALRRETGEGEMEDE